MFLLIILIIMVLLPYTTIYDGKKIVEDEMQFKTKYKKRPIKKH